MNWNSSDLSEAFGLYKQKMILFLEDEQITDEAAQARKICRGVGDEGLKRLNASGLDENEKKNPDELWKFFDSQLKINVNFRIHRLQLMQYRQQSNETIDDFITRARTLALKCDFEEDEIHERLLELVIASTPHEPFRKDLLGKNKGTHINEILQDGRKYEAIAAGKEQLHRITQNDNQNNVDFIRRENKCFRCSRSHARNKCPAMDSICNFCKRKGHWEVACLQKKKSGNDGHTSGKRENFQRKQQWRRRSKSRDRNGRRSTPQRVHTITEEQLQTDEYFPDTVNKGCENFFDEVSKNREQVFTILKCKPPNLPDGNYNLKLKVDTGASGNTLPLRTFIQMYGSESVNNSNVLKDCSNVNLTAYNGESIKCVGSMKMPISVKGKHWDDVQFYVVDVPGPAIIGLQSCENLGLVTIHVDMFHEKMGENVTKLTPNSVNRNQRGISVSNDVPNITDVDGLSRLYPNQFDKIGKFQGEAKLLLKDNAEPYVAAPRKCSIHMKDKIKAELDRMEQIGVIRKVSEHTDWCSNVVFTEKKDGSIRVCLDPQKLNQNLKRCPHKIPTVEELNPEFANAKVFSKLDAKSGYWAVQLDEESQLLTCFRSPLGQRYCFLRLPFGLVNSQDIFQNRMDEILEGLPGVVSIADDVCVHGKDDAEHDRNLIGLMDRATEKGLVFNKSKCSIKQSSISFYGNVYTSDGVKPDPIKIRDVQNMAVPQNKDELKTFLGMVSYLSQFIPKFADKTHILRQLCKESTPWFWDEIHQRCFEEVRQLVSEQSCLKYYNPKAEVTLEVDASMKGLGAAIIQNGKIVAFASKTLTETQSRYSNIEREMLAIVFGIQRFHVFLYGRPFTVVSDHKPLSTITAKPINSAPLRLQRMLLQIQGYNYKVTYRPGPEMILVDALSRLPNQENDKEIDLETCINSVQIVKIALINFSDNRQSDLVNESSRDPILNQVKEYVYHGWPNKITELPNDIRPYFSFRDELALEGGVLFKGKQVVIPAAMTHGILEQLHASHQGIEKTRSLARESVYWLNINKDIERVCKSCTICQEYQCQNKSEPLIPHEVPVKQWQFIASDIFQIKDRYFLITVDRYSKFPLVDEIQQPVTSEKVAEKMKMYCSIFGKCSEIMTDNGPQYSGPAWKKFVQEWAIRHVTSSPHFSQSNGFIERHIRYVKSVLKKTMESGGDIQIALLNVRATPVDSKLPSPAEILLGHPIVTLLPSRSDLGKIEHREQLETRKQNMVDNTSNVNKTELEPLYPGQNVRILNSNTSKWLPGTVVNKCIEPRSYNVITPQGKILRRNRAHLRPAQTGRPNLVNKTSNGQNVVNPSTQNVNKQGNDLSNVSNKKKKDVRVSFANPEYVIQSSDNTRVYSEERKKDDNRQKCSSYGRNIKKPSRFND